MTPIVGAERNFGFVQHLDIVVSGSNGTDTCNRGGSFDLLCGSEIEFTVDIHASGMDLGQIINKHAHASAVALQTTERYSGVMS